MQERELTLSDGKAIDGKIFNLEHKEYLIQIDKAGYSYIIFGNMQMRRLSNGSVQNQDY